MSPSRPKWMLWVAVVGGTLGALSAFITWLILRDEDYVLQAMGFAAALGAGLGSYATKPLWDAVVKEKLEHPVAPGLGDDARTEWVNALRTAVLKRRAHGAQSQLVQMVSQPEVIDLAVRERVAAGVSSKGMSRLKVGGGVLPWSSITREWDKANGRLVILGEPGYGKTVAALTLLRHINVTSEKRQAVAELFPLVEWSRWTEQREGELGEWLAEQLATTYDFQVAVAQDLVDADLILPLLDGLDEVPNERRRACKQAIESYAGRTQPFRSFVLTCRVKEYAELLPDWVAADRHVALMGLDPEQIVHELDGRSGWEEVRERIAAQDRQLIELFRSPLRLGIALATFRERSPHELLHFDTVGAQAHLWESMLTLNAGTFPKANSAQVKVWLQFLAAGMVRSARQRLWLHELYRFAPDPRAEQARFASVVAFAAALALVLLILIRQWSELHDAEPWFAWGVFVVVAVFIYVRNLLSTRSVAPSVRAVVPWSSRIRAGLAGAGGFSLAAVGFLLAAVLVGLAVSGVVAQLIIVFAVAGVVGLLFAHFAEAIRAGTAEISEEPPGELAGRGPRAVLTATRKRAVAVGLAWGLLVALLSLIFTPALGHGVVWWVPLVAGAATALMVGFYQLVPWLYYHWVRLRLAQQGLAPRRLNEFLNWCAAPPRSWLRASDAYEFRHRELLDHLAGQAAPSETYGRQPNHRKVHSRQ